MTPPTTYYTTRVQKIPNTGKYPRYSPPKAVSNSTQHVLPVKPHMVLSGQVGADENIDDGVNRGVGAPADALLKQAPPLGAVHHRRLSGNTFKNWMKQNWPALDVSSLKNQNAVVVKGRYDHAEHVLDSCRIPYVMGDKSNLAQRLALAKLLIINCPGDLPEHSIEAVKHFLERGGFLITTDWALSGCLQRICPGYVHFDGAYSKSELVDAVVVTPQNDLVKGVSAVAPWKLDDKSELVKPGARKSVQVLARSRVLSTEDPIRMGVLAVTFDYGKGHVLHLIGHVDNNTDLASAAMLPDPSPQSTISLRQVISLNFIARALSGISK